MYVGNLRSKLPTKTFPSVIQLVTTDENLPSVVTDWITDGKVSELKKRRVTDVEVLAGYFFRRNHQRIQNDNPYSDVTGSPFKLPTESLRVWNGRSEWWHVDFLSESPTYSPTEFPSVKPSKKVNICKLCWPSPPLFLLLLPNINSPHLQTTSPPPPKTKISLISAQQVIFLEVLWSQHPCSDLMMDFINFCK